MREIKNSLLCFLLVNFLYTQHVHMFALPGKFDAVLTEKDGLFQIANRASYNQTNIQIKISCEKGTKVKIGWLLRESHCIDEFLVEKEIPKSIFENIFYKPEVNFMSNTQYVNYIKSDMKEYTCNDYFIDLYTSKKYEVIKKLVSGRHANNTHKTDYLQSIVVKRDSHENETNEIPEHNHQEFETVIKTWSDSAYLFILFTKPVDEKPFEMKASISFKYKNGYIAANDWPLLPFYAVMCAIYIIYAIIWFTCSCCYWRDLLRVQFWVGGVILLGMIEKAAYLAEFETVNRTGYTFKVGLVTAEVISCLKRSLARMLVIIVSLGFGIVKPRLGPTLHKVGAVGFLYFILSLIDSVSRVLNRKEDTDNKGILAGIPLVILDVSICYWILTNLQQTIRTLRVRRNIPKLTLYRHFTNTLIFCVFASVVFMAWSLKRHRFVACLKSWKELWLDDAFWHILFSFILLVIIILWRPSNNSQRFLFTPLLDNDDDDDEERGGQENEVFDTVKMRTKTSSSDLSKATQQQKERSIEDDLKWVEEHVPASVTETTLPGIIDSDEEATTTRFEMSKMD